MALLKENLRVIILTLVFLIILFSGDRLIANAMDYAYEFSSMPDAMLYSNRGKADVLILGNSRAYHHFDDGKLSNKLQKIVKNYAIQAASMEYNEAILNDYINIYGVPKVVILELTCLTWDNGQVLNMRGLSSRSNNIKSLLKKYYPREYYIGETINIFNYNSISFLNVLHKIIVPYKQPLLNGKVDINNLDPLIDAEPKEYFKTKDYGLIALENIYTLSKKKGFQLYLIVSPFLVEFIKVHSSYGPWLAEIKHLIQDESIIFDYSSSISNSLYFKDLTHLNSDGVNKFHQQLINDGFFNDFH